MDMSVITLLIGEKYIPLPTATVIPHARFAAEPLPITGAPLSPG